MPDHSTKTVSRLLALAAAAALVASLAVAQSATTPAAASQKTTAANTQTTTQSSAPKAASTKADAKPAAAATTTASTTTAPAASIASNKTSASSKTTKTADNSESTFTALPPTAPALEAAQQPDSDETSSLNNPPQYDQDKLMPGVKKGSIQDVNAVGERKIGGRGVGNWYSTSTEIKIGKQYSMEVEKSSHIITDPVVAEYINRIGQNIVKNSDCKVPFTIKVIDSDEINAFALPGGFFFVNSGLILAADDEAELAGVMAHETAHVCAHHAMREMTRMNIAQIASIAPMIFIGGWTGYGIYEAESVAIPVTFLEFSREFEAQADYLGIQYMYRAGYDPEAMVSFFEKIEDLQKHKPGAVAKVFSDHPQTPDRIQKSQEEIAHILPPRAEYLEDTSEFEAVKARLARIENKRRLHKNNLNRPSLRRAKNNGSQEPPTLHRRDNSRDPANTTN
ncbi:MAG TPA: M48 family metallopeptidase [Acidobacteriaceae bacterium]|nr:M48 family metallopeptidase [Acidobacteriaceae bacterium]